MKAKHIIILVLAVIVIVFFLQNTQVVDVWFLFWKISISRIVLLFGTLVAGVIVGWLLRSHYSLRSNGKNSS